jgi:hypothetical protein
VRGSDSGGGGGGIRGGDGCGGGDDEGAPPISGIGAGCGYGAGGPVVLGRAAVGPDARLRRAGPRRGAGCWAARRPRRVRWPAGLALLSGLDRMGGLN